MSHDQPSIHDYYDEDDYPLEPEKNVNPDRGKGGCEHCGKTFGQWGVRASKMRRRHEKTCEENNDD
jgi:hypothetical protein